MRNYIGLCLGFCTFLVSTIAIYPSNYDFDFYVLIHIIIIGICSFSLFNYRNRPFSLYKIFHLFHLFFFGIAPVLQHYENIRFVGEPFMPFDVKMITSSVILIVIILFNLIYYLVNKYVSIGKLEKYKSDLKGFNYNDEKFSNSINLSILIVSVFCFVAILAYNNFNLFSLFFRGGVFSDSVEVSKTASLLIEKFFRPLSLCLFIISFSYNRNNKFLNIVLFVLLLLTAFPLGMARNAAAGFYLPLLLLFVPIFKRSHFFSSSMIFGLLIIFPFLDNFRRFKLDNKLIVGLNYDMFLQLHFDAYATFARIIYHDIVTYGYQLLGVFLFFVPRSIWPSKPLSSGQFHAQEIGMTFDNLACTYLAEGYINFGYFGVILFLICTAYFTAVLDKAFWSFKDSTSYYNVIYVLIIGMFLFILRGDLMNGYAYTVGMVFTALFTYKLIIFMAKLKIRKI